VAIIIAFVVPAILDGRDPLVVALVGAFAVMLATIPLTHGLGAKLLAAALALRLPERSLRDEHAHAH